MTHKANGYLLRPERGDSNLRTFCTLAPSASTKAATRDRHRNAATHAYCPLRRGDATRPRPKPGPVVLLACYGGRYSGSPIRAAQPTEAGRIRRREGVTPRPTHLGRHAPPLWSTPRRGREIRRVVMTEDTSSFSGRSMSRSAGGTYFPSTKGTRRHGDHRSAKPSTWVRFPPPPSLWLWTGPAGRAGQGTLAVRRRRRASTTMLTSPTFRIAAAVNITTYDAVTGQVIPPWSAPVMFHTFPTTA